MRALFRIVLAVLLASVLGTPGFATETGTMRCSGGIVSVGDATGEVLAKCGQPALTSQHEEKRVEPAPKGSRDRIVSYVTVDDWTYNFGPNEFLHQLTLENGRVVRIIEENRQRKNTTEFTFDDKGNVVHHIETDLNGDLNHEVFRVYDPEGNLLQTRIEAVLKPSGEQRAYSLVYKREMFEE